MPRTARKKSYTNIYHVVIKGIDKQIIFENERDYKKYIELLELYKNKCNFILFAYCLMSNHVHLLLQTKDVPLSTIFRKLNTCYSTWFNMKYQRTGHVQDGRFYSQPVENLQYLLSAINYIHLNPLKAGLEQIPGEKYLWSSIHEYKSNTNNLVNTKLIFSILDPVDILKSNSTTASPEFIDINNVKKRLPDDVARQIIQDECNCSSVSEFQALSLLQRNNYIARLRTLGISIRQLSRLTGVSRGVIQAIMTKGHSC